MPKRNDDERPISNLVYHQYHQHPPMKRHETVPLARRHSDCTERPAHHCVPHVVDLTYPRSMSMSHMTSAVAALHQDKLVLKHPYDQYHENSIQRSPHVLFNAVSWGSYRRPSEDSIMASRPAVTPPNLQVYCTPNSDEGLRCNLSKSRSYNANTHEALRRKRNFDALNEDYRCRIPASSSFRAYNEARNGSSSPTDVRPLADAPCGTVAYAAEKEEKKDVQQHRHGLSSSFPEAFVSSIFQLGLARANPTDVLRSMKLKSSDADLETVECVLRRYQHHGRNCRSYMSLKRSSTERNPDVEESVIEGRHDAWPRRIPASHALDNRHEYSQGELILPTLSDDEKKTSVGASMGYLLGLFLSLVQQLNTEREQKVQQQQNDDDAHSNSNNQQIIQTSQVTIVDDACEEKIHSVVPIIHIQQTTNQHYPNNNCLEESRGIRRPVDETSSTDLVRCGDFSREPMREEVLFLPYNSNIGCNNGMPPQTQDNHPASNVSVDTTDSQAANYFHRRLQSNESVMESTFGASEVYTEHLTESTKGHDSGPEGISLVPKDLAVLNKLPPRVPDVVSTHQAINTTSDTAETYNSNDENTKTNDFVRYVFNESTCQYESIEEIPHVHASVIGGSSSHQCETSSILNLNKRPSLEAPFIDDNTPPLVVNPSNFQGPKLQQRSFSSTQLCGDGDDEALPNYYALDDDILSIGGDDLSNAELVDDHTLMYLMNN